MTPAVRGRLIGLTFISPLLLWFALSLTGLPVVFWPGVFGVSCSLISCSCRLSRAGFPRDQAAHMRQ